MHCSNEHVAIFGLDNLDSRTCEPPCQTAAVLRTERLNPNASSTAEDIAVVTLDPPIKLTQQVTTNFYLQCRKGMHRNFHCNIISFFPGLSSLCAIPRHFSLHGRQMLFPWMDRPKHRYSLHESIIFSVQQIQFGHCHVMYLWFRHQVCF